MFPLNDYWHLLTSEKIKQAVRIQSGILRFLRGFLERKEFVEILPVIISPITDPLTDHRIRGEIECYGLKYQITKSMIFHKQIAVLSLPQIFSFSPNVRIEPAERRSSGRHLIEFVHLDLEMRGATREEVMALGEELLVDLVEKLNRFMKEEIEFFGRRLKPPSVPENFL